MLPISYGQLKNENRIIDISENAYESIREVGDTDNTFLFDASYINLDFESAKKYFDNQELNPFACSVIVKNGVFGRNFDWFYNNQATFRITTNGGNGRYSTSGIATMSGLDKDLVKSGVFNKLYKYLPFSMVDGQNEKGLHCAILVVPNDKGDTTGTYVEETREDLIIRLNAIMLIRYCLDNFANIEEVKYSLQKNLSIYVPQKLRNLGYECHFVFKDNDSVWLLEFEYNNCVWVDITDKPIVTNFFINGVTFKEDGSVYQIGEEGIGQSGLTIHSQGLERYNLLLEGYNNPSMSVKDILESVRYTQLYKKEYWDNPFVSEYCGTNGLTILDDMSTYYYVYIAGQREYANRSRENPAIDQTVHCSIYSDELKIYTQERFSDDECYTFKIANEKIPSIQRIECETFIDIDGHLVPEITYNKMVEAISKGIIANNKTLCVYNSIAGEFYSTNMTIIEGTDITISFLLEDIGILQYYTELKGTVETRIIPFEKEVYVGFYDENNKAFYTTATMQILIPPKNNTIYIDVTSLRNPKIYLCYWIGYDYDFYLINKGFDPTDYPGFDISATQYLRNDKGTIIWANNF